MTAAQILRRQQSRFVHSRAAFTIMETCGAIAILAIAMMVVAQMGYWSLRHRMTAVARQVAIEQAINVLEAARAQPWSELDQTWAESRRLDEAILESLPGGTLQVRVEPHAEIAQLKRVIVQVGWNTREEVAVQPIRLEVLLANRAPSGELQP